jgi:hypothetical protein
MALASPPKLFFNGNRQPFTGIGFDVDATITIAALECSKDVVVAYA